MMTPITNDKIDELRRQLGQLCMRSVCTRSQDEIEVERQIVRRWAADIARDAVTHAFKHPTPKG